MKTRNLRFSVVVAIATVTSSIIVLSAQPAQQNKKGQQAQEAQIAQAEADARGKGADAALEKGDIFLGDWLYPGATKHGAGGGWGGQTTEWHRTAVTNDSTSKVWAYYADKLPLLGKELANHNSKTLPWNSDGGKNYAAGYHYEKGTGYVNVRLPSPPRTFGTILIQDENTVLLITISQRNYKDAPKGPTEIDVLKRQILKVPPVVATAPQTVPAQVPFVPKAVAE